jgi:APA family basic amino acid/polyamine antiporter
VIVLRRKYPDMPRPYRMWGYPVTPIVFVAVTVWFVANTLISKPGTSIVGSLIILSGIPAYFGWRWREQKKGRSPVLAKRPSSG